MNKIIFEDVSLGAFNFLDQGTSIEFEILNTYDGGGAGKILCKNVMHFMLRNHLLDEPFCSYIALIRLDETICDSKKEYKIVMESGTVWIEVVCVQIEVKSFGM
ncbi:MAG: hypothetical protein LBS89_06130 [Zoogloeaceae bacterium]|jgi:hypothetical protein|nr:hypothetical protein [Zoogloeaceae bacterium]